MGNAEKINMLHVRCNCGTSYSIPERLVGRTFRCKKCKTPVRIDARDHSSRQSTGPPLFPDQAAPVGRGADTERTDTEPTRLASIEGSEQHQKLLYLRQDSQNKRVAALQTGGLMFCLSAVTGPIFLWLSYVTASADLTDPRRTDTMLLKFTSLFLLLVCGGGLLGSVVAVGQFITGRGSLKSIEEKRLELRAISGPPAPPQGPSGR